MSSAPTVYTHQLTGTAASAPPTVRTLARHAVEEADPRGPEDQCRAGHGVGQEGDAAGALVQGRDDRLDGGQEPDEALALPEALRGQKGHRGAHHRPPVGHEGDQAERRDQRGEGGAPGPPVPGGRDSGDENGQDAIDHACIAGQPRDTGAQGRRDPVAPREGEETGGGRGEKEALAVGQGQDVGRGAEHVEQDGPVGQSGAEDLPHRLPDGERRGEAEDERGHERGVGEAEAGDVGQGADRQREAGEEGPAAPVALVEEMVRVAVLRDQQVPAAVPDRAHGVDHPQSRDDGGGDQGRADDRQPGEQVEGGGAQEGLAVWQQVPEGAFGGRPDVPVTGRVTSSGGASTEEGDAGASMSPVTARPGAVSVPGAGAVVGGRNAQPRRRENRSRAAAAAGDRGGPARRRPGRAPPSAVAMAMAAVVATRLTP